MSNEELKQLARIYNTLALVETKGEGTIYMSDCLRALKAIIENGQNMEDE